MKDQISINFKLAEPTEKRMRPVILLHPNIPKPLHGMNPRSILGKGWWDEQRQIAYAKENYHCMACGIHKKDAKYHKWLEAHECYEFDYPLGIARMIEIVALCHSCHNFIHSGKLIMDLQSGRITESKFHDIMGHGERIIMTVRSKPNPYIVNDGDIADWNVWRLIIEGKEYHSKFKSFAEWREHYSSH